MDFGTVNFEDLFDFSPEPLDSREAEVQRQNEAYGGGGGGGGGAGGGGGYNVGRCEGAEQYQVGVGGEGEGWRGREEGVQYSQEGRQVIHCHIHKA